MQHLIAQLLRGAWLLPGVATRSRQAITDRAGSPAQVAAAIRASQILTRWLERPCLRRALLAQALLARLGVASQVKVGLAGKFRDGSLDSHAWLELDDGRSFWQDRMIRTTVFCHTHEPRKVGNHERA